MSVCVRWHVCVCVFLFLLICKYINMKKLIISWVSATKVGMSILLKLDSMALCLLWYFIFLIFSLSRLSHGSICCNLAFPYVFLPFDISILQSPHIILIYFWTNGMSIVNTDSCVLQNTWQLDQKKYLFRITFFQNHYYKKERKSETFFVFFCIQAM